MNLGTLVDVNTAESSQHTSSQSVTGCVPVPGSDLPGPGYIGVGISNVNRSVTSCVAAPGNDLPGPGVCSGIPLVTHEHVMTNRSDRHRWGETGPALYIYVI